MIVWKGGILTWRNCDCGGRFPIFNLDVAEHSRNICYDCSYPDPGSQADRWLVLIRENERWQQRGLHDQYYAVVHTKCRRVVQRRKHRSLLNEGRRLRMNGQGGWHDGPVIFVYR